MSVILPSLAIGHTPTEELCFLVLFSAQPQQYHQHAHCTLIITTRRLFSSVMTHKQTPGVPTKFLKSSSSFYFSPFVAFQKLHHGCLTGPGGDLFTFDHLRALLFIYYQPNSEDARCHHDFDVSYGCTHPSAAVRQQYRHKQEEYHPLLWDCQNYSRFPALSSSSAANGCMKIAPLATVIYNLWSLRLQSKSNLTLKKAIFIPGCTCTLLNSSLELQQNYCCLKGSNMNTLFSDVF